MDYEYVNTARAPQFREQIKNNDFNFKHTENAIPSYVSIQACYIH